MPSSYTILIDWLKEDNNYERWKGSEGDSQLSLAGDIVQLIVKHKCVSVRAPGAVVDKVNRIQTCPRPEKGSSGC